LSIHHIGAVVAGSILTGLILALFLVFFPFGGAEENVISGMVLLSFGFGWLLLAILSQRLTDQSQHWAVVPAALNVLTAVLLLTVPSAVTWQLPGWVWPPVVLVLVVWMAVQVRKHLHSPTGIFFLYAVFAVLVVAALGGAYETYQESRERGAYRMAGKLYEIDGRSLYLHCVGSGGPTVVLVPGLSEPSSAMSGWIAPDVARTSRACVYDRAGRGWSESESLPQDGEEIASDLRALLTKAGEAGPFVLVGHSAGGPYILNFAKLYPDDVAGIVLLDSMHPQQYERLSGFSFFIEGFRRASALFPSLFRLGVGRLVWDNLAGGLPDKARAEERMFQATPRHARSIRDEFTELRTALKQSQGLKTLNDKPLAVVSADRNARGGWQERQNELLSLSSNSVHRVVKGATHTSLVWSRDGAAGSAQAIKDVVEAARGRTQLAR
jgi:pimeloyl-ACP methyl ester carboxylesterase